MTFKIITLGCKMNAYESEALREKLLKSGYIEEKKKEADCYIVNTCAVTHMAEKKDMKVVRDLERDHPNSSIFVMGCSSQIHKEMYLDLKNVKAVYGTFHKDELAECILHGNKEIDNVNKNFRSFTFDDLSISKGEHEARSYIKIQDGCDNFCSYCIVPYTRGVSRSRNHHSILEEMKRLLDNDVKEIIIGGIDVGSYKDPHEDDYRLKHLLKDMCEYTTDKKFRIRISSIECSQIDDEYIQLFKDYPDRLCPHFHIPLQSGCEKILRKMNRKYKLDDFYNMTVKIKQEVKNVALSTDVIFGFPTEKDEDFLETYEFIKRVGFMRIHAFPYSEREGTVASRIKEGIVPVNIRRKRTNQVIKLGEELEKEFRESMKGQELQVLIEGKDKEGLYQGYSENYLEFHLKDEKDITNSFKKFKL